MLVGVFPEYCTDDSAEWSQIRHDLKSLGVSVRMVPNNLVRVAVDGTEFVSSPIFAS